jgi:hypothetical protein
MQRACPFAGMIERIAARLTRGPHSTLDQAWLSRVNRRTSANLRHFAKPFVG